MLPVRLSQQPKFHRFACMLPAVLLFALLLPPTAGAQPQGVPMPPRVDHMVHLETTKGPIDIRVFFSLVPYTASNFLNLVSQKFYDGLSFHRVEDWVVQGGDPTGNGQGVYRDPQTGEPRLLKLEINNKLNHNAPGTVAMARSQNRNSASCQFYITKRPAPFLNGQYAVFGHVVNGMNTVYKLQRGDRILSARISDAPEQQQADAEGGGQMQQQQQQQQQQDNGGQQEDPRRGAPPSGDSGF